MNQQIKALTGMRGIAALMIVIHHFPIVLAPEWGKILQANTQFVSNSYLWVDFFFILSGFVMAHAYRPSFQETVTWKDYKQFMFSRFVRLYPLHLLILLLFVALETLKLAYFQYVYLLKPQYISIIQEPFTGRKDIASLFMNLFLLQGFDYKSLPLFDIASYWNQPAWSISVQLCVYCVFPFVLFWLFKQSNIINGLVYIFSIFCLFLVIYFGKMNHLGLPGILRCFSEGMAGVITYMVFCGTATKNFFCQDWILITPLMILFFIMHTGSNIHLVMPVFSMLILSVSKNNSYIARFLSSSCMVYLGVISYSVYMSHWLIQDVFKFYWQVVFHADIAQSISFGQSFALLGVEIFLILLFSSSLYFLIETKSQRLLQKSYFARKFIYKSA